MVVVVNTLPGDKILVDRVNTLSINKSLVDRVNTLSYHKLLGDRVNTKALKRVRIYVFLPCIYARKPHEDVLSFSEKRFNKHFLKLRESAPS